MANRERPRAENPEKERNPEQDVSDAATAVENRDETDPVISSEWMKKSKEFLHKAYESPAGRGLDFARFGIFTAMKAVWGILKFAKKAIEKQGKVTFKEGYEIGEWIVDTGGRKDK